LPLACTIEDKYNFEDLAKQIEQECHRLSERKSYLFDCWQRYPELASLLHPDKQSYRISLNNIGTHENKDKTPLPQSFLTLCEGLLNSPKQPVAEIDWVSAKERKQLLVDWNSTDTAYPAHKTIHGLFEEQVKRTPHHLALIAPDAQLTYQDLNKKANQLAHYLITHHAIQPDQLIAVCLERSHWMLIALLGILKSGGAYVPLDPDYPAKRISYILNDTNAQVVITTQSQAQQLRQLSDIDWKKTTLLVLDQSEFPLIWEKQATIDPVTATTSHHLIYVMYTSGTSGTPKGVEIEHKSIVNQIFWINRTYPLRLTDRILQKTPYVFDISVWELFWANLFGATIVFAKPEGHKEPIYLSELIRDAQINIIQCTPSMLSIFAPVLADNPHGLSNLRHLFCIGEVLHIETVNKVQALLPKLEIHNLYGPTEASINALSFDCTNQQSVYLGKPISNTRAYVLDKQYRLLPVGVIGELHIAGVGLARGYLNEAELTAQQFIANPFQTEQEKHAGQYNRLYKTGDLARLLPDGNLDYLGRYDTQVKLHGYRIELTEIEHVMQRYPDIFQSVVIVMNNMLVAYYVAQQPIDREKIQSHVGQYLPRYMVPARCIFLKNFPLAITGKVDKKKLPLPPLSNSEEHVRPANKTEGQLAAVFATVLDLEQSNICVTDDFFKLGGDSILAIRLISLLNKLFPKTLRVKDVLEHKTIQALSAIIENPESAIKKPETVYKAFNLIDKQQYQELISTDQVEDIYPASYLQIGMLLESSLNDKGTYHDVFNYEINVPFDQKKFLAIWEALANKHALLRARFLFSDQHALDVVIFKKTRLHYRIYADQPLQPLIDAERLKHFTHTEECLFHLIVNKHRDNFEFIFSFHHAIVDGWGVASLINEFVQAYANNQVVNYPILPNLEMHESLSYGEFVQNERRSLNDQSSIAFWKDYLVDSVPADAKWKFDEEASSPDSLFSTSILLNAEEAALVQQVAHEHAVTVDNVFLFSYIKTLSFFLNSVDITIGVVFNNRLEKVGGDSLFGLFLNVLPFRLQLKPEASLQDALVETSNSKMRLYEHKHIPYAHIKSIFDRDLYKFGFSFINFHILKPSEKIITNCGGFNRTSIPFLLEVTQGNTFKLDIKVHDDYINQEYLNYFGHYLKMTLLNVLRNKNELTLDTNDYQKIVIEWNATHQSFPDKKTLHQLFEEQVQRNPDAIALVFEDKQLTYRDLNQKANQLAYHLIQKYQVKSDELIVLCLNRNELMVVAILAVLKSGAAYVPVEPDYPDERISYILHDTETRIILTNGVHQNRFSSITQKETYSILVLDEESTEIQSHPFSDLDTSVTSSNLAYVIYTSGTTGKSNGVMIEHKGVVNLILDVIKKHKLSSNKRVAFYSNYAFDCSVYELFSALSVGCQLFILPNPVRHDLQSLNEYFTTHGIQVSFIPSGVAGDFIQTCRSSTLELIYMAGDRCVLDSGTNIEDLAFEVFNEYGITETTICTTYKKVEKANSGNTNVNIIGRPFSNNQCYIFLHNGQLAPFGVIGELFVGGIGLARGYLNNSELTNQKFIINPFQNDEEKNLGVNERLYKSGDLARLLPNGDMEYIARNDNQVKIWGYRIELSEIERALNTHPNIKQSIVLQAKDSENPEGLRNHLIAYYVERFPEQEAIKNHTNTELRAYLAKQLPKYMVPRYFIPIDKMPLTTNSKIDHKALPQPIFSTSDSYIPPQTSKEKEMCTLFAHVLGLPQEKIGITDDFFLQLGGSSIQAIKLIAQINKAFQTNLRVRYMFTHQGTIRKLLSIMEIHSCRSHNDQ
jgi:amino acid adenylation domain-containing protein